jgi:hypothetical protein
MLPTGSFMRDNLTIRRRFGVVKLPFQQHRRRTGMTVNT